jgi:tetratricopeptide repeat protein 30
MKSLEPYQKKLGTDTWFYTKRCFLSLFENMARHSVIIRDQVLMEMLHFLSHCESKRFFFEFYFRLTQYFRFRLGSRC